MKVHELIEDLYEFDPETEVVIDMTLPDSEMIRLVSVSEISGIETDAGEVYVMIEGTQREEPNLN